MRTRLPSADRSALPPAQGAVSVPALDPLDGSGDQPPGFRYFAHQALLAHLPDQQTFEFLLDTGADFSLAPRTLAEQIGLNWTSLPAARIVGVERTGAIAKVGELPIRIGARALHIRCVFLDTASTQFVLGRADFLDHFVVTIDQPGRKIVLEAVPAEPANGP